MCIVCIANNINRNVYIYLNTRILPATGYMYVRVSLFMFTRRELGGTGTGYLFQFAYCETGSSLARTNLSPFARCTLGLNRHFY